jgi:hypothetical protein
VCANPSSRVGVAGPELPSVASPVPVWWPGLRPDGVPLAGHLEVVLVCLLVPVWGGGRLHTIVPVAVRGSGDVDTMCCSGVFGVRLGRGGS